MAISYKDGLHESKYKWYIAHRDGDPVSFADFYGQASAKALLSIGMAAALKRNVSLDHVLLHGPASMGKVTFARIIAKTMGRPLKTLPSSEMNNNTFVRYLAELDEGDVILIENIHALKRDTLKILPSILKTFYYKVPPDKRTKKGEIEFDVPEFTLIATTDHFDKIESRLKSCFEYIVPFRDYDPSDLASIVMEESNRNGVVIEPEAANMIGYYCNGTPLSAKALYRRVRDYAQILSNGTIDERITKTTVDSILTKEEIEAATKRVQS